jgi:tetratricopeptide (TPR) repeat protein
VIRRAALGETHPDVAQLSNNIAGLLRKQGKIQEALEMYERSLVTLEVRKEALVHQQHRRPPEKTGQNTRSIRDTQTLPRHIRDTYANSINTISDRFRKQH